MRAACVCACVLASLCVQTLAVACGENDYVHVGVSTGAPTPVFLRHARVLMEWSTPSLRGEEHALATSLLPRNYYLGRNVRVEKRTSLRVSGSVYSGGAAVTSALLVQALNRASGSEHAHIELLRLRAGTQSADVTARLESATLACHDMLSNLTVNEGWGVGILIDDATWRVQVRAATEHTCLSSINVSHAILNCTDGPSTTHPRLLRLGTRRVLADACSPMPPMLASTAAAKSEASFSVACAPPPPLTGTQKCRQKSSCVSDSVSQALFAVGV